jgi:hypothetical protein
MTFSVHPASANRTKIATSPLRQCLALSVVKAELRVIQLLARARCRRCFAFSLAFRLFARIVLLDLTVLFTWSSDLDAATLSYPARPTLAK